MVWAGKRPSAALFGHAHTVASVRTAVVEQVDFALLVTRHDHRLWTDGFHDVVVGSGDFAFMTNVHPCPIPDLTQLFLVDRWIGIERPMHLVCINQLLPVRQGRLDRDGVVLVQKCLLGLVEVHT